MKHWAEARQVADRLGHLRGSATRAALATVVRVRGSAYRRPGARLLVDEGGDSLGNVSGGCLEADVREVALRVIGSGRSELRSYCSGADPIEAWDLGLGCEGEVEVLVTPAPAAFEEVARRLSGDRPFVVCLLAEDGIAGDAEWMIVEEDGVTGTLGDAALDAAAEALVRGGDADAGSQLHEIDGRSIFIDRFSPPPRLLVFGAGDDARPLVRLALESGFEVSVFDRRPAALAAGRFPERARLVHAPASRLGPLLPRSGELYALLMNHSFAEDRACAEALLPVPLRYLGMLGPRARTERMLADPVLSAWADDPRLFGPVGLDVGTEGAEQVAIAVIAELLAVRSGRRGGHLRDRCAPIHLAAAVG